MESGVARLSLHMAPELDDRHERYELRARSRFARDTGRELYARLSIGGLGGVVSEVSYVLLGLDH